MKIFNKISKIGPIKTVKQKASIIKYLTKSIIQLLFKIINILELFLELEFRRSLKHMYKITWCFCDRQFHMVIILNDKNNKGGSVSEATVKHRSG